MTYVLEIFGILFLLIVSLLVYRALVRSPKFTRFIENTVGPDDAEDAIARAQTARENVGTTAKQVEASIHDEAEKLRKLKQVYGND